MTCSKGPDLTDCRMQKCCHAALSHMPQVAAYACRLPQRPQSPFSITICTTTPVADDRRLAIAKALATDLLLRSIMAQAFRLLALPAELRYNIYHHALLPETLHVSLTGMKGANCTESFDLTTKQVINSTLRSPTDIACLAFVGLDNITRDIVDPRRILFDHVFEYRNKLVVEPFSISRFRINRQIYAELDHLFYNKCTWFFSSSDGLVCGLVFLPDYVRIKIRHLAFTLMSVEQRNYMFHMPIIKPHGRAESWTLRSISALLQSNLRLHSLSIHYSKLGRLVDGVMARELRQLSEGQKAACAVTEFFWPGVETRLLYGNAEMTRDLVESVGTICGANNIEWRSRGTDKYSTALSVLVIRQRLDPSAA